MSGVLYDIMMELGRLNQIKIDWSEELTWATVSTAIGTGRVDAMCSGMWIDTQNGAYLAFSDPFYFNSVSAYGRANETRFTKLEDLNNATVRVATRDGGTPAIIARQDFPQATVVSLPSGISEGELVEQLLTNKADVFFYGDDTLMDFMSKNPGKLKPLFSEKKLRIYALAIALPMQDVGMKNMINNSISEMKGSKVIERALKTHALPGSWVNDMSGLN